MNPDYWMIYDVSSDTLLAGGLNTGSPYLYASEGACTRLIESRRKLYEASGLVDKVHWVDNLLVLPVWVDVEVE